MDIKELAKAAGFDVHPRKGEIRSAMDFCGNDITATVEKFARLVAEECAAACEEWRAGCDNRTMQAEGWAAQECADAIRKRSNA